jgi:hypothetical protein
MTDRSFLVFNHFPDFESIGFRLWRLAQRHKAL